MPRDPMLLIVPSRPSLIPVTETGVSWMLIPSKYEGPIPLLLIYSPYGWTTATPPTIRCVLVAPLLTVIAVTACWMLTYSSQPLPLLPPRSALNVRPFQEGTSGSASKVTLFAALVFRVDIDPPSTSIPTPCEKTWTGPLLPSITSCEPDGTVTPAAHEIVSGRITCSELLASAFHRVGPEGKSPQGMVTDVAFHVTCVN